MTAAVWRAALKDGFVYQGEPSKHRGGKPRGTPSGNLPPTAFVLFLQNHDQIGNRAFGERLTALANPKALEAAIALQLLCPQIPLIFMGEQNASKTPFCSSPITTPNSPKPFETGGAASFRAFRSFPIKHFSPNFPIPTPSRRSNNRARILTLNRNVAARPLPAAARSAPHRNHSAPEKRKAIAAARSARLP